ncbi:hypothetical protein [Bordetella sp. 15P40C-2]|uniref:DUF7302 family protein n=1 Tax=Bordetella sp. 15P40C-2 TaxID=2572246 RepID=UPI001328A348|nr:hypothetical protein [Bordetella sp. 15P40C-2]MVW72139.1 hypothetical protein [Bordetella sp. 15P40C-2]
MDITAKSSFVHGSVTFKRGATAEVSDITGKALISAGLVTETAKATDKPAPKGSGTPAPKTSAKNSTSGPSKTDSKE